MPLLGKRKYINEQIEKILNKLEERGYNVTYIKNRWYDIVPTSTETIESEEVLSSGAILPYRKKVNEVLKMIEDLLQPKAPNANAISEDMNNIESPMYLPNDSSNIKEILRNAILSNKNEQNENKSNINQYDFMN